MRPNLAAALRSDEVIVAPGIDDIIAAVVANKVGFDFVYASGFWLTASACGLLTPDGPAVGRPKIDRQAAQPHQKRISSVFSGEIFRTRAPMRQ